MYFLYPLLLWRIELMSVRASKLPNFVLFCWQNSQKTSGFLWNCLKNKTPGRPMSHIPPRWCKDSLRKAKLENWNAPRLWRKAEGLTGRARRPASSSWKGKSHPRTLAKWHSRTQSLRPCCRCGVLFRHQPQVPPSPQSPNPITWIPEKVPLQTLTRSSSLENLWWGCFRIAPFWPARKNI